MITCASCGTENPEGARFCHACGPALASAEPRRKEQKFATALLADLVGSTTLAEEEDPEVVQSVVGCTFDRMAEEIARYEGPLEKFMGDAVLAVFGVPRAHEDDAERAVRAGLEMRTLEARAMVDLGRTMTQAGDDPREVLERARQILLECDAKLFISEVDEALAEANA